MNNFKRHQSKVFWEQMLSQDLKKDSTIRRKDPVEVLQFPPPPTDTDYPSENDEENRSSSLRENNFTNVDNVTVIHVCPKVSEPQRDRTFDDTLIQCRENATILQGEKTDITVGTHENKGNTVVSENRSLSPLSQDLKSLDSGFSDSERSNCSQTLEDESPQRRRRRRKKAKERNRRIRHKIGSIWSENDLIPRPTCTSTPKDPKIRNFQRDERFYESRVNRCDNMPMVSQTDRNATRNELRLVIPMAFFIDKRDIEFDYLSSYSQENSSSGGDRLVSLYSLSLLYSDPLSRKTFGNKRNREYPVPCQMKVQLYCYYETLILTFYAMSHLRTKIRVTALANLSSSLLEDESLNSTRITKILATNLSYDFFANFQNIDGKIELPVKTWLNDLTTETANECCIALQNKNLPRRKHNDLISEEDQMKDLKMLSSLATAAASKLLVRADQFERHYQYILDEVSHSKSGRLQMELLRAIEDDAFSVLSKLGAPPPRRIQQTNLKGILMQLDSMKDYIDSAINTRLDFYIEKIVRCLEEVPKEDSSVARGALAALTALGLAGARAGSSIARCSGIRALLTSLISAIRKSNDYVATSLRALSSVCCSRTAIEHFVKDDGPEIVIDLLSSKTSSEINKMEATALIVQITAPWTNAVGLPHVEPFADTLIIALGNLIENVNSEQTLLLTAAALNQISKSRKCADIIIRQDTIRNLLRSVKKSNGGNVWLMQQVASLIGELARLPEAREYLAKARASVALVCFLRMRPPGLEDAYQRLETTAAAALIRLCVDPEIARQVVAVGGADCLPTYDVNYLLTEDEEQIEAGLLKYTKSLRRACKKAVKQIDVARAHDYFN
ncbi:Protein inscuteable like protein [Vespula squamosa]|uniref:Protein inscuteable like protein n=1 Tax=Vespula squamosa TaxID=30214 RepID=A0ABD2ACP6_VESSQ